MKFIAIVTRKLKPGKTYADFRKAWFHTVGFGTSSKMYTMLDIFDPSKVTVIGMIDFGDQELSREELLAGFRIDVKERLEHSLDNIIEPEIERSFGMLVAEDDFSAEGAIEYVPPSVNGKITDLNKTEQIMHTVASVLMQASQERDEAKK